MKRWPPAVGIAAIGALLLVVVVGGLAFVSIPGARILASSSAPGTSPEGLLGHAADGSVVWSSDTDPDGAWLEVTWPAPRSISGVLISGAAGTDSFQSAAVTFDGADSLLLTAGSSGAAEAAFERRSVSTVRIAFASVVEGAQAVALSALAFPDSAGGASTATDRPVIASVSSGSEPDAIVDGDTASGGTGEAWTADPNDASPWIELSWAGPRTVASVQVFGPEATYFDPASSASAPLHGQLVFDDGSRVDVAGIDGGMQQPTTVAFMPRIASSVRLELARTIPQAAIVIREFAVYDAGVTPPQTVPDGGLTVHATTASCDRNAPVGGGPLALVCPAPGSVLDGPTTVVVSATPGAALDVASWTGSGGGPGSASVIASPVVGVDGTAEFELAPAQLPAGPVTVRVSIHGSSVPALYVQVINPIGPPAPAEGFAPATMTLQWDEEFDAPLSISETGAGARYAATKPAPWGTSEFGEASFVDPADHPEILATSGGVLRVRVEPRTSGQGQWGQQYLGGILSSSRVGAAGFSAQYGYFEARILGAPGAGSWPAFWMLDAESAANRSSDSGEIDAVELYGHNTTGSCHSAHNWIDGTDTDDVVDCLDDNGRGDWGMSWHTYGARVMPDGITYYIDGAEVASNSTLQRHGEPYFFLVNLALGGGWPIDLAATGGTTDMYVDWVRVYT